MTILKSMGLTLGCVIAVAIIYLEYAREKYVIEFENIKLSDLSGIYYSCSNKNMISSNLISEIISTPTTRNVGYKGENIIGSEFKIYLDLLNGDEFEVGFFTRPSLNNKYYALVSINDLYFKTIEGTKLERKVRRYCTYGG